MSTQTSVERQADLVAGLRAAADFIESHPGLPMPYGVRMYASIPGTLRQLDRFTAVHAAAETMGVPVTAARDGGRQAKREFGPVELTVFAVADDRPTVGTVVTRGEDTAVAR